MNPGRVLVVTGPPAAGKTTLARLLATNHPRSVHLHADDFWHYIVSGYVEPWLPESDDQNRVVMTAVCGAAADFARGGYDVVLDGVLGPWFLPTLAEQCPVEEIAVDYLIVMPPLSIVLERLACRTGHGFSSVEATTKMYDEFVMAIGGFERHVVDTVGQSPEDTVGDVEAARTDGRLRLLAA